MDESIALLAISDVFRFNTPLKELILDNPVNNKAIDSPIRELDIKDVKKLIYNYESSKCIDMSGSKIDEHGEIIICGFLENINNKWERLNLSRNKLVNVRHLCTVLKTNSKIQELNLSQNDIRNDGGNNLAKMLKINQSLKKLNITGNKMGPSGFVAIRNAMRINQTLQELYIGSSKIGISHCQAEEYIADILQNNKTLQVLDISESHIKNEGAMIISTALKYNTSLKILHIAGNNIDDKIINEMKISNNITVIT
jgi:Ran GTPase-activating protein (RanGAP) involved in mRNA processing and transport